MAEWTQERVSALSTDEIKSLRKNADTKGRQDIAALCDQELIRRKPVHRKVSVGEHGEDRKDHYVSEFHFVCPGELGVTRNQDGTIWTGTWVVAEKNADNAVKYGAIVALHTSKAEASYLQGPIVSWRKSPREDRYNGEQSTQREEGIDFLFQPSNSPMPWKGNATGEKGYAWARLPK